MSNQIQQRLGVEDRLDIIEAVTGIGFFADLRDLQTMVSIYEFPVRYEYASLLGDGLSSTRFERGPLLAFLEKSLLYWDTMQHIITNTQIGENEEGVIARSHVRALHTKNGLPYNVSGYYTHGLRKGAVGWKAFRQHFTVINIEDPHNLREPWAAQLPAG